MWACHVSYAHFELLYPNNPINSTFKIPVTTACTTISFFVEHYLKPEKNVMHMWETKCFGTRYTDLTSESNKVSMSMYKVNIFIGKSEVYIH